MKDFKEFLLRGNLVEMAVGIVIGLAFTAVFYFVVKPVNACWSAASPSRRPTRR